MNYYERAPETRKADIRRAMIYSYRIDRNRRQRIEAVVRRLLACSITFFTTVAVIAAWL